MCIKPIVNYCLLQIFKNDEMPKKIIDVES